MAAILTIPERLATSYREANVLMAQRVADGTQPPMHFATPQFLLIANIIYVVVTKLLYDYMSKRKTRFEIKPLIAVYNVICVFLAGYVVVGLVILKWRNPGKFVCNPGNETDADGQAMAHLFWVFYIQKFWEFLDTWFFILRKSFRQVTFLHLFHHSSITLVVGLLVPYDFSGDMFLPVFLNAFVHVLMYSHYLATALGINSWWRKHLTSLQLIQFVLIGLQSFLGYYFQCGSPDFTKFIMVLYMCSMLFLFGNFFLRRYILNKRTVPPACAGVVKEEEEAETVLSFQGVASIDHMGATHIIVPKFPAHLALKYDVTVQYQLTAIGAAMPKLHISKELSVDAPAAGFGIAGGEPYKHVSWAVSAVCQPIRPKSPKRGSDKNDTKKQE